MMKSGNVLVTPCDDVNKTVPYFKEFIPTKYDVPTMDDYLFNAVNDLTTANITFN